MFTGMFTGMVPMVPRMISGVFTGIPEMFTRMFSLLVNNVVAIDERQGLAGLLYEPERRVGGRGRVGEMVGRVARTRARLD